MLGFFFLVFSDLFLYVDNVLVKGQKGIFYDMLIAWLFIPFMYNCVANAYCKHIHSDGIQYSQSSIFEASPVNLVFTHSFISLSASKQKKMY